MGTTNNIDNKRQFLDYEGLAAFWNGIKERFADANAFNSLSSTIDGFADSLEAQGELLTKINAYVETLSPLQANSYVAAEKLAETAPLGSIIYVNNVNDRPDKLVGPYMVTNGRVLMYISLNPVTGDITEETMDKILNALTSLQQTVNDHDERLDQLENNMSNKSGIPYEIVNAIPSNEDIKEGVIYFVNENNGTTNLYTEYIGIKIGNTMAIEKIGGGITDVKSYIDDKLEIINQNIQILSTDLETLDTSLETRAIAAVLNGLQSYEDESIGTTIAISKTTIDNLLNS